MTARLLKNLALSAVRTGIGAPENPICRYLELTHLKKLIKLLDINCVLDVGANRGQFGTELRRIGYTGRIVSFEPVRSEFALLKKAFEGDARWQGYRYALGCNGGTAEMNVISDLTVMSSLRQPMGRFGECEIEQVEVRQLDDVFPEVVFRIGNPRVFLKMDTQGYDLEVFKGARRCIHRILGLQSELSVIPLYRGMPHYLDALSAYESAGFDLFDLTVVTRTFAGGLQELNCLMKRRTLDAPS